MLLRLVVVVVVVYLIYRLGKALFLPAAGKKEEFPRKDTPMEGEDMVQDPYCGTYVPLSSAHKESVNGRILYFCSKECCEKFRNEVKGR